MRPKMPKKFTLTKTTNHQSNTKMAQKSTQIHLNSAIKGLVTLLITSQTLQWHSQGHMLVAEIARQHLLTTSQGTAALNWANRLLRPLAPHCGEKFNPFVESATYPDKVGSLGWKTMSGWHFIDQPVLPKGYNPKKKPKIPSANVVFLLHNVYNHLISSVKKSDMRYGTADVTLPKSFDLRFLIHMVGDIHQPIHSATLYSEDFPTGDAGGNLFMIKFPENTTQNLHFVWDNLFNQGKEVFSPLTIEELGGIFKTARSLMSEFGYLRLEEQLRRNPLPEDWARESWELAKGFVYVGIKQFEALPEWYVERGKVEVNRRLALAGYRLAEILVEIFEEYERQAA